MDTKQIKNLETVRDILLSLPADEAAQFDITSACRCAWGIANEKFFKRTGSWSHGVFDFMRKNLGIDYVDVQFLFQNNPSKLYSPVIYRAYLGGVQHDHCLYENESGPDGIAEFADRVENVLQYYASLKE